jgi:RNA polymerase sigma factor (sigma-70 family)
MTADSRAVVACPVRTDEDLFEAWRKGDNAAGQAFARALFPRIRRFFASKCGAEVEELVQRTLVRLVEAKDRYEGQSSPRAFVLGVARNVLREHYRARVKSGEDVDEATVRDLADGASTMRWRRLEDERLLELLRQLPLHMQTVLELYYWDELSGREVAEVLDVPEGTVASRLRRAKTRLQEVFEAGSPTDGDGGAAPAGDTFEAWAARVRGAIHD